MCIVILHAAYDMYVCAVTAVEDALNVMRKGTENRRIGETNMNRESSRSHSVFTCIMESSTKGAEDGCTRVKFSRLNLVDLAGKQLWPLLAFFPKIQELATKRACTGTGCVWKPSNRQQDEHEQELGVSKRPAKRWA